MVGKSFIDLKKMEIAEFLKTVIHMSAEGDATYKGAWSDSLAAQHLRCTAGNVRGIRQKFYPTFQSKFRPEKAVAKAKKDALAALEDRVTYIEQDILARLEDLENDMLARLTYLETELGVKPTGK